MTFWDFAAMQIACALVRYAADARLPLDADVIARDAAALADKLEKERAERVKRAAGSKPS